MFGKFVHFNPMVVLDPMSDVGISIVEGTEWLIAYWTYDDRVLKALSFELIDDANKMTKKKLNWLFTDFLLFI